MSNTTRKLFQLFLDETLRQFYKIAFHEYPKRHYGFIRVGARGLSHLQCELQKIACHYEYKKDANGDVIMSSFSKKAKQSPYSCLMTKLKNYSNFKPITKGTYLCP
jgi:hypothetical protein